MFIGRMQVCLCTLFILHQMPELARLIQFHLACHLSFQNFDICDHYFAFGYLYTNVGAAAVSLHPECCLIKPSAFYCI